MKIFFVSICLVLFFTSCRENKKEPSLKESEYFSITDSTNYINSRSLKGFSEFIINKTTVRDISKIHYRSQTGLASYLKIPFERSFTDGYFKVDYSDEDLINILSKQKKIAQYHLSNYKINNTLIISSVYLLCIDDTLAGIYIPICEDIIIETFLKKYGSGYGYKINDSELVTDPISKKENIILDVAENRVWENKTIKAEYNNIVSTKYLSYTESDLLISDKTGRFTRLNNLFNKAKQLKREKEDALLKEAFNKI